MNQNSVRKSFFTERIINGWNFLHVDIVNFTSLSSFRIKTLGVDYFFVFTYFYYF